MLVRGRWMNFQCFIVTFTPALFVFLSSSVYFFYWAALQGRTRRRHWPNPASLHRRSASSLSSFLWSFHVMCFRYLRFFSLLLLERRVSPGRNPQTEHVDASFVLFCFFCLGAPRGFKRDWVNLSKRKPTFLPGDWNKLGSIDPSLFIECSRNVASIMCRRKRSSGNWEYVSANIQGWKNYWGSKSNSTFM